MGSRGVPVAPVPGEKEATGAAGKRSTYFSRACPSEGTLEPLPLAYMARGEAPAAAPAVRGAGGGSGLGIGVAARSSSSAGAPLRRRRAPPELD